MIVRKLNRDDETQLHQLIENVEESLIDPTFWLPITATSEDHFFDDSWTYFLGAFQDGKLVGALGLFLNENEYGESVKELGITGGRIGEFGRAMVHSEYRHRGIMNVLGEKLLDYSRTMKLEYLVATVHPENVPSQKVFEHLGFTKMKTITKLGIYRRDIFLLSMNYEEEQN